MADEDDDGPLSDRQLALLEGLRESERAGRPVDLAALVTTTGYSESSIRTYFTKKLEGVLVFRDEHGWRVRGAVRCTEEEFARRMTQKAGAAGDVLRTEESWRAVLRKLLYEGQRRHYVLSREELELVDQVSPRAARGPAAPSPPAPDLAAPPPPAPDLAAPSPVLQPDLFGRSFAEPDPTRGRSR